MLVRPGKIGRLGKLKRKRGIVWPPVLITGLEIELVPTTTWVGTLAVAVVTADGTNHMPTTLVGAFAGNTMATIDAGEYTSNTSYTSSNNLKDPFHDWSVPSPSDGTNHYNGANDTESRFIKFASEIDLSGGFVQLAMWKGAGPYSWAAVNFKDQDGNVITPRTAPADYTDENGDATVDGVTTNAHTDNDLFKWTF